MSRIFAAFIAALILTQAQAASTQPAFKAEVRGAGRPIILIPGSGMPGANWDETAARLCGPNQCHILTLAGFAGAPSLAERRLLDEVELQLAAYIDGKALQQPVIIGHSLGGFVGMRFAARYPDKVGRLVILDTMPALGARGAAVTPQQLQAMADQMRARMEGYDRAGFNAAMRKGLADMVSASTDLERIVAWAEQSDRAAITQANHQMLATDLRPALAGIRAPTLVLGTWAAYAKWMPKAGAEAMFRSQYAQLANVRIEMAEHARHFIMYDEPEWMLDRIQAFIQ